VGAPRRSRRRVRRAPRPALGAAAAGLSLHVQLPKLISPALDRLCDAVAGDDPDPELLDAVAQEIDEPLERARLARAVIAQAERGGIDRRPGATALIDLASPSRLTLRASPLEAVAVARTPAGILLAA
jgi:hypothetical protein